MEAAKSPTIGVHLIARDEEKLLPACLRSVASFADEIVLVDTGSADGTPRLATAYGAIVARVPWRDDFSAARNAGLALATTDWILVMDADEEAVEGAESLKDFLRDTKAERCGVSMTHALGERPEDAVTSTGERLFRNGRGYRYAGRVHEQLVRGSSSVGGAVAVPTSPLKLLHIGYRPEELSRKRTAERNLRLLEREAAERPQDPFVRYNLGVTYCQLGHASLARESFEASLALAPPDAPYRATLIRDYAQLELAAGREVAARKRLLAETERYPQYPDLHYLHGMCLRRLGRLKEAARAFEAAMRCDAAASAEYICLSGSSTYRSMVEWADIARRCGLREEAVRRYLEALNAEPAYAPAWRGWIETMLEEGGAGEEALLAGMRERIDGEATARRETAARALADAGVYGAAVELLEALERLRALTPDEQAVSVRCLASAGLREEAFARSRRLVESGAENPGGEMGVLCALAAWSLGRSAREALIAAGRPEPASFIWLEAALLRGGARPAEERQADMRAIAPRFVDAALSMRLPELAESIAATVSLSDSTTAGLLYARGYVDRAANRYLGLLRSGSLDAEGAFALGETLVGQGHYSAAAGLFERALAMRGDFSRARFGAAECYVRMANEVAIEGAEDATGATNPLPEAGNLDETLLALEGLGWRTARTGAEKGNAHA
ncbi:glycosyltransferase [Cohnella sp. GCM10027633]|uniref:glycosyltransferase n=1 Tax=unclassified Cohnella TaxID=2636738 RepID=UPI0036359C20